MAHLILFSDADFRGDHKHVVDAADSLRIVIDDECVTDCEWPSSVSSLVIISGTWEFFAEENFQKPFGVNLGPGLYRFVNSFKLENDHVRSMRPVDGTPTMPGEPLSAIVTLFEHENFRGNHVHLFEEQMDLGSAFDFAGITSSIVIELGNWSFFSDTQFDGSYPGQPVLGPGIYPTTTGIGIDNDTIASLQVANTQATVGNAVDNHVILFRHTSFYGHHRHVFAAEPNLNSDDDDEFNDAVRSLAILAGSWWFYSDAGFSGLYKDDALPPDIYPFIDHVGLKDDDMSSLRPVTDITITTGETILGEVILFRDANFGGPHKHVVNAEPNLNADDDDFFNDNVSSFVVLEGNWKFFRHAGFSVDYPAVVGPGLYPSMEPFKIRDKDISSLQVVDADPNTAPGAPLTAHMALFQHQTFRGDHRHIFQRVDSFYTLDNLPPPPPPSPQDPHPQQHDLSFENQTSSMMVFLGNWQTFADPDLNKPFPPILGPGLYAQLPSGIDNDAISSLTPSDLKATASGSPVLGHIILFEHGQLHGGHKHIFNKEPDLNNDEDDSFNDETSSLVVYPNALWEVKWKLYRDSVYHARFDVILGAGRFPSLVPINVANDALSSLELAGDRYDFSGHVTVMIQSGSFPDPITHDVTMSFIFLPDTMALLLETPFEPFGGPKDSTISLVNAGNGTLPPDGAVTLLDVQIKIAISLGITSFDAVDIAFDLTTGHVDSPHNAFHDTGTPLDPLTGALRLVGAGRANDDDFLVILEGTLTKE